MSLPFVQGRISLYLLGSHTRYSKKAPSYITSAQYAGHSEQTAIGSATLADSDIGAALTAKTL
jgi:hypothetical protein